MPTIILSALIMLLPFVGLTLFNNDTTYYPRDVETPLVGSALGNKTKLGEHELENLDREDSNHYGIEIARESGSAIGRNNKAEHTSDFEKAREHANDVRAEHRVRPSLTPLPTRIIWPTDIPKPTITVPIHPTKPPTPTTPEFPNPTLTPTPTLIEKPSPSITPIKPVPTITLYPIPTIYPYPTGIIIPPDPCKPYPVTQDPIDHIGYDDMPSTAKIVPCLDSF